MVWSGVAGQQYHSTSLPVQRAPAEINTFKKQVGNQKYMMTLSLHFRGVKVIVLEIKRRINIGMGSCISQRGRPLLSLMVMHFSLEK